MFLMKSLLYYCIKVSLFREKCIMHRIMIHKGISSSKVILKALPDSQKSRDKELIQQINAPRILPPLPLYGGQNGEAGTRA